MQIAGSCILLQQLLGSFDISDFFTGSKPKREQSKDSAPKAKRRKKQKVAEANSDSAPAGEEHEHPVFARLLRKAKLHISRIRYLQCRAF